MFREEKRDEIGRAHDGHRDEYEGMHATWHVTFYNVYFINCSYTCMRLHSCFTCKLLTQMLHKRKKRTFQRFHIASLSVA